MPTIENKNTTEKKVNPNKGKVVLACGLVVGIATIVGAGAVIGSLLTDKPADHIHIHNYSPFQITAPTATENGLARRKCNSGDYEQVIVLPALTPYNIAFQYNVKRSEVSCEEGGEVVYEYRFEEANVVFHTLEKAHGHSYGNWIISQNGKRAKTVCSGCGDEQFINVDESLWEEGGTATCEGAGTVVYTYPTPVGLPVLEKVQYVSARGHEYQFSKWISDGEGNEYLELFCDVCDQTRLVQKPDEYGYSPDQTQWEMLNTTASCTASGSTEYRYIGDLADGEEEIKCTVATAKPEHDYTVEFASAEKVSYNRKDGTFTVPFNVVCKTKLSGVRIDESFVEAGGNVTVTKINQITAPTCTQNGAASFVAIVEDYEYKGNVLSGSKFYQVVLPAGHTVSGVPNEDSLCADCGQKAFTVPALETVFETCTQDGTYVYAYYDEDGELKQAEFTKAATGHDGLKMTVSPTPVYDEVEKNYFVQVKIECNNEISPFIERIYLTEDYFVKAIDPATCETKGSFEYRVKKTYPEYDNVSIDKTVTAEISALGHDFGAWTVVGNTATSVCAHGALCEQKQAVVNIPTAESQVTTANWRLEQTTLQSGVYYGVYGYNGAYAQDLPVLRTGEIAQTTAYALSVDDKLVKTDEGYKASVQVVCLNDYNGMTQKGGYAYCENLNERAEGFYKVVARLQADVEDDESMAPHNKPASCEEGGLKHFKLNKDFVPAGYQDKKFVNLTDDKRFAQELEANGHSYEYAIRAFNPYEIYLCRQCTVCRAELSQTEFAYRRLPNLTPETIRSTYAIVSGTCKEVGTAVFGYAYTYTYTEQQNVGGSTVTVRKEKTLTLTFGFENFLIPHTWIVESDTDQEGWTAHDDGTATRECGDCHYIDYKTVEQ